MKIAILDSYACDFSGLSWEPFKSFGKVTIYPRTLPHERLERADGVEAVIVNKVIFDRELIMSLKSLRYIGVTATGVNNVDIDAACARGITVTNVPDYSSAAVSQMVFAHILNVTNKVSEYALLAKNGSWSKSPDFCLHAAPIYELSGKTLGVVGYGSIGKRVAAIASAFGMKVLIAAIPGRDYAMDETPERFSLQYVLQRSDYVSLHCSLSKDTEGLIGRDTLQHFKHGAVLINTARGGLIDEGALVDALKVGRIKAACLDVLNEEPPRPDHILLELPNLYVTPHIAWATEEARARLMQEKLLELCGLPERGKAQRSEFMTRVNCGAKNAAELKVV